MNSDFSDQHQLSDLLPASFVVEKPMDGEAGGDGYWICKKEDIIYLAIYDCMGHGRLARMTSRIYINALKKVIVDIGIEYTGSILQYIHREIQSKFEGKEERQISTGADLGIVKIDIADRKMEYAGARIDLFVVKENQLEVFKSDRMQVGEMFDFRHQYNSNTIELDNNSEQVFYLTTDGAKDLIGGQEERKIGKKDLKNLLTQVSFLRPDEQALRINTYLEEWQGENKQPDDILIIGFKV